MNDHTVNQISHLLHVRVGLFNLEQGLDAVDVLIVDDKVVELAVQAMIELGGETTSVEIASRIVQLVPESFYFAEYRRRIGKELRIETLECDEWLAVNVLQKVFGFFAHLERGAKVHLMYHVARYIGLAIYVTTAAKVLAKVFAVVECLDFVDVDVDATIGAPELLKAHLIYSATPSL